MTGIIEIDKNTKMAVRTIQQIQKELAVGDKSQRALINKQLKELPKLFQGQVKGLEAKQKNAFADILSGAKQRGLKFSGIPLAEQAEYTSDVFLPALAGLEEQRNAARTGLQGALADIIAQRSAMAQQIRQQELDRQFQAEQAAASRAAARAAAFTPSIGDIFGGAGGGAGGAAGGDPINAQLQLGMQQRKDGGYNFTYQGQPISAAEYNFIRRQAGDNQSFRNLLQQMADAGDKGAAYGLRFIGDDYGYDPRQKIGGGTQLPAQIYQALTGQTYGQPVRPFSTAPAPSNNYRNTYAQQWSY